MHLFDFGANYNRSKLLFIFLLHCNNFWSSLEPFHLGPFRLAPFCLERFHQFSCYISPLSISYLTEDGASMPRNVLTNRSFGTPSRLLIDMLGFKTLELLITAESKIVVFRSLHDLAPQYLRDLLTRNSNSSLYVMRNTGTDLKLPKKTSCNGQRCISYRGAKKWKDLPE